MKQFAKTEKPKNRKTETPNKANVMSLSLSLSGTR